MSKKASYKIFPEHKLIIEYYDGNITMADFIQQKKIISLEENYSPNYTSLLDFRDAIVDVNKNDMFNYINFAKNSKAFGERTTIYLTNTPNDVVVTTIFSSIVERTDFPIKIKIFSTLKAVNDWIAQEGIDEDKLSFFLYELKTTHNNI